MIIHQFKTQIILGYC